MPVQVLIVDVDDMRRSDLLQTLREEGYEVTAADSFQQARRLLKETEPDLLITDVRLKEFNGLQLVLTRRAPAPAIVLADVSDPILETEARKLGAEYLPRPFSLPALLQLVEKALERHDSFAIARRWVRKPAPQWLFAQVEAAQARILDVSYGGLRLEMQDDSASALPSSFDVALPMKDVSVHVDLVWQSHADDGSWMCGVELSQGDAAAAQAWHGVVDAIA
jgi:DNA-binding response OmpR family regulator